MCHGWMEKRKNGIENCEGGNSMRFPMNYKERNMDLVDISLTIFHFDMNVPNRN